MTNKNLNNKISKFDNILDDKIAIDKENSEFKITDDQDLINILAGKKSDSNNEQNTLQSNKEEENEKVSNINELETNSDGSIYLDQEYKETEDELKLFQDTLDKYTKNETDDYPDENNEFSFIDKEEPIDLELSNSKDKNDNKKYKLSKDIVNVIMLVISGVALVLSIWIMFKSFSPMQEHSTPILSYNVSNGIKYKIHLHKNDFYDSAYLGMNELVPTPFINYIEIDFSSMLQSQKKLDYNYTYKVTGDINAYYTGGDEDKKGIIWSKSYTFVNPVSKTEADMSSINLNQKVNINYSTYNNLVNKYKLKASVPMEAYLTVTFTANVNSQVENSDKNLNENIVTSVKIPLSVATVQLTTENNSSGSKVLSNTETTAATKNYVLLGFSIILFIGSLALTIKLLVELKKMTENHSVLFKLNKILKDHDQVVVEVETVPKVKNATIIEIKQFKDMIDIQQELHIPILYYKSETLTENSFYIIHNNQIYRYVINSEMEQL